MNMNVKKMKALWLAPYPLNRIRNIPVKYRQRGEHPCTWIVTLSDALSRLPEVELHIITQRSNIAAPFHCFQDNIHFHFLKTGSTLPFLPIGYSWILPYDVFTGFKKDRKMLLKKIREINPDIIHVHGTETPYAISAVESGYPHLISLQGIISRLVELNPSYRNKKLAMLEKEVIRRGENFVAKTDFIQRLVQEMNPTAIIYPIDNIVNPAFFRVSRNGIAQKRIVFAGSISPAKGAKETLLAFAEFSNEFPDYQLDLIGGGSPQYISELKAVASTYNISDKIHWHGFITHQQMAEVFSKAKILVFPSQMDTSPNIVAEAMVSGLPVIATRVGGIPDMISHNQTGYLIEKPDHRLIYAALKTVLENDDLYRQISEKARSTARLRFSEAYNVEKVLTAYQEILQRNIVKPC
ncbi:MAG: glycosyltransferase family 4 protein [Calditrichaceae bacterium]|nr:glycosyltransferase family 4 protein [Calditrichia bacterium]NUQ42878.1 glycosyltransferase family 4 protein [Calditrichaceae bacterium]